MPKSKLCESCIHTRVCFRDKNLVGDVFVMGNPLFVDNEELYKKFKEREKKGFPCDEYIKDDGFVADEWYRDTFGENDGK